MVCRLQNFKHNEPTTTPKGTPLNISGNGYSEKWFMERAYFFGVFEV
jgi:hypothetical protein